MYARRVRSILFLLVGLLLAASCNAAPTVPADSPPGSSPTLSPPGPGSSTSPEASPPVDPSAFHPLPPDLRLVPGRRDPSASLTATSVADAQPGIVQPFRLEHCGLASPFDFDGSLWDPVAGRDAQGEPIDSEEEIGELINATEGEVVLLDSGQVQFRTAAGSIILLTRHVGARAYLLCA